MLNDQRFDSPVIHVVSESPRLEMLQTRLRQAGFRPVPVRGNYLPPDSAPALIDALTRQDNLPEFDSRLIVTIGKQVQAPAFSDIHLTDIAQLESLPSRLAIHQREKQRQRELQLRTRTAEKFGVSPTASHKMHRARLLWLGPDAPFLNAVKASLSACNVSLVAAISRLTAEDYLAGGRFQTFVLCPAAAGDEAAKLLERIKSLAHASMPRVVLLLRPELSGQLSAAAMAQADQILDLTADIDLLASRLHAISSEAATDADQPDLLGGDIQDKATGLVSRQYLESHLQAQMDQAEQLATPLSVVAFSLASGDDLKAIARTVKSHLRDTDLAARLDANHICITLPETGYRGAVVLARRIEQALGSSIDWRAIERRRFHTLRTLLGGLTARSSLTRKFTA